jgi:cation diffusion facilitator family transporter
LYLVRIGRRAQSPTLEADGLHVLSDVWTTALVAGGLGLVLLTGWEGFDPIAAMVAGANLLWMGGRLVRQAVGGLMDEADPATLGIVETTLGELDEPTLVGWTSLRARCQGNLKHVDLTIHVPEETTVAAAHRLADRVERAIARELGTAEVLVHIEPASLLTGRTP